MTKRNSNKRSKAKGKAKNKITWRRTSLGPLRQGQQLDTSETKTKLKQRAQTTNPKLEQHKELPLHTCKLPLSQSTQDGHLKMHDQEQTKLTQPREVKPPTQVS
jgi:hypothetical protein